MPNPFVGPHPLSKSDPIFGRDREIAELRHLITAERLVLLLSPSGAGKSSLINAGLIPELKDRFDVWEPTRVNMQPPPGLAINNRYAWSAVVGFEEEIPQKEGRRAPEALTQFSLNEYVATRPRRYNAPSNVLLIFDQFEEILRVNPSDTAGHSEFFRQLAELISDPRIWALFVIREDYLAPLLPLAAALPTHLRTRYRLDFLTREQAKDAMRETALTGDRTFQPHALTNLVNNLAAIKVQNPDGTYAIEPVIGAYVEPLQLQVVCRRLWDAMPEADRSIDPEDVAAFGDVTRALGAYYDSSVAALCNGHKPSERLVREWFHEKLITTAQIRGQVQMGPERSEGLWNSVIEKLLDTHLVRAEKRRGFTWFELAHDRLIQPIVTSNLAWFEGLHDVEKRAIAWRKQGEPEGLLLSGADLQAGMRWAAENAATLTPGERAFLESSNKKQIAEEATRQAALREATQHKRKRRWFILAGVLAIFLFLMWGGYLVEADRANKAESRRFRQEARDGFATNPLAEYAKALRLDPAFSGTRVAIADLLLRTPKWLPTGRTFPTEKGMFTAVFSADGTRVVTASADKKAQVWDAVSGAAIGKPMVHEGWVNTAAFSPDGRHVVTASDDGTAQIWDAGTGDAIGKPMRHTGPVKAAAFSPDGRRIVIAGADKMARVWDAAGEGLIGATLVHTDQVNGAAFSPDGKRIVTASNNRNAQVWDAESGEAIGKPMAHRHAVNTAAFSPDGTHVLTASSDALARIWDVSKGEANKDPLLLSHSGTVWRAAYSADGLRVVTASEDGESQVWDAESGEAMGAPLQHEGQVYSAAFSPDGSHVVTASDENARVWSLAKGAAMMAKPMVHTAAVRSATFSGSGRRVVTVPAGNTVQIWDGASGEAIGPSLQHKKNVNSAVFSADGERVVTASDDHTAQIWNVASGKAAGKPLRHNGPVNSAVFSADGARVVTASADNTARIWDAASAEAIGKPLANQEAIRSAVFSADGRRVLTVSIGQTAQVWDVESRQPVGKPLGDSSQVNSAAFSPDGLWVVTANVLRTAQIWDTESGKTKGNALQHKSEVLNAVFSGDGSRIVTYSWDNTARIWDGNTGAAIGKPLKHKKSVTSAAISADGRRVVTGSSDGMARIWDANSGEEIGNPLAHNSEVNTVAFSPDGQRVVTASEDRTARIWDLTIDAGTPEEIELLAKFAEAVDGSTVNDDGSVTPLEDQPGKLRAVLAEAKALPDTPGTLAYFIRRYIPE